MTVAVYDDVVEENDDVDGCANVPVDVNVNERVNCGVDDGVHGLDYYHCLKSDV